MIRPFEPDDRSGLIALWRDCDLVVPWNDPERDIDRKLANDPQGLLVAYEGSALVGSVMVGYDGHRGWINYLAAHPSEQRSGLGRHLMEAAEAQLAERGCPKINLQIRSSNHEVMAFYASLGYSTDPVTSMGKRLIDDS